MQDQLRLLISNHCTWLRGQVETIAQTLARPRSDLDGDVETYFALREQTHQISGSTGTMGFKEIGRIGAELETTLQDVMNAGGMADDDQWSRIVTLTARLQAHAAKVTPEASSLFNKDLSGIVG